MHAPERNSWLPKESRQNVDKSDIFSLINITAHESSDQYVCRENSCRGTALPQEHGKRATRQPGGEQRPGCTDRSADALALIYMTLNNWFEQLISGTRRSCIVAASVLARPRRPQNQGYARTTKVGGNLKGPVGHWHDQCTVSLTVDYMNDLLWCVCHN